MNDQIVCILVSRKVFFSFDFDAEIDNRCFSVVVLTKTVYTDRQTDVFILFSAQTRLYDCSLVKVFLKICEALIDHRKYIFLKALVVILVWMFNRVYIDLDVG